MKQRWQPVFTLLQRELRDQLRDWRILSPIIILTMIFPLLMNLTAQKSTAFVREYGAMLVAERMVPFFLLVVGFFPITVGLVVALESFVGEKERGTIEPLLSSPLADWQLYAGKFLAGLSLPLGAAFLDIGIYLIMLVWQKFAMPPWWMLAYACLLTLLEAVTLVSAAMFISSQSATVRGANLLASFIVIPMALLLQAESAVLFFGDHTTFWVTILGLSILSFMFVRLGLAHFQRELLLNRRNNAFSPWERWRIFWQYFSGGQTSLRGWYADIFSWMRKQLGASLLISLAMMTLTAFATYLWVLQLPGNGYSPEEFKEILSTAEKGIALGFGGLPLRFTAIFFHNLRAILAIMFMGVASFSLFGLLLLIVNFALIGGVLAGVQMAGYSSWEIFIRGILPHGIFELPAMILAGALIFYAGLVIITPQTEHTLGDLLLRLTADWARVFLGILLPLLFFAALVEAYITPHLLKGFL